MTEFGTLTNDVLALEKKLTYAIHRMVELRRALENMKETTVLTDGGKIVFVASQLDSMLEGLGVDKDRLEAARKGLPAR